MAAMLDPGAFRAFWRLYGMLEKPDDVYTDPAVVECTRQALRKMGRNPAIAQPSREQLMEALTPQTTSKARSGSSSTPA
jgi:hypothetical protein